MEGEFCCFSSLSFVVGGGWGKRGVAGGGYEEEGEFGQGVEFGLIVDGRLVLQDGRSAYRGILDDAGFWVRMAEGYEGV